MISDGGGPYQLNGRRSPQDPSLYYTFTDGSGERVNCVVYVDDLCFSAPPNSNLMKRIEQRMDSKFWILNSEF